MSASTELVIADPTLVTMSPKTVDRTDFGERLHRARLHAKLSQERLAELVQMTQTNISHLEQRGEGSAKVADLARECGVRVQWLASGKGPMVGPETPQEAAHVVMDQVAAYAKPSDARDYRTLAHTMASALEQAGVSATIQQFLQMVDEAYKKLGRS